jgi:hypothetical protein
MAREEFEAKAATLRGDLRVVVDGREVALTDAQKVELAKASLAIRDALPEEDRASVDFLSGLNADQVAIIKEVGSEAAEAWAFEAVISRWKGEGREFTRGRAAAELEIAVLAHRFLENSR